MRASSPITSSAVLLLALVPYSWSYRVLGLFPYPAPSHQIVFDALMVELAKRGHNVTTYNTMPNSSAQPNYTRVDLTECFALPTTSELTLDQMVSFGTGRAQTWALIRPFLPTDRQILSCRPLLELRNSSEKYDLIITETMHNDFFALFGPALDLPVILFHSCRLLPWMSVHAAVPDNPAHILHAYSRTARLLDFWDRLENFFLYSHSLYAYKYGSETVFDEVAAKFFGPGTPSIWAAVRNVSLLLVNAHHSFGDSRPMVPNAVEVGGLNVQPVKALPKDIEKFINESTHGVVYFCMGSLLRGETFPVEKRNAFLSAFAKLPQRVLWKWEGDVLPGKSDNIMISKWMPQRDILAHPNVKLFISHGGLLGTSEAVYEGVPVLGIPVFGDQRTNIRNIETNGAGEILEYHEITAEVVYEKVSRLLNDPKYKQNAADLSSRYRDRPMSPLDTAVYWTEYVIRHKGAHHLKTAAVHMPWYQYLLLDVIAFLIFVVISVLTIVYYILKTIYRFLIPVKKVKTKTN